MNVRTLCLSILYSRDASGYEIRKMCTEGECSYFAEASFGSIYPALAKLEDENLVTSQIEHQTGKPNKKIYSITQAGRAAFVEALHQPINDDVYRSPFLLLARYAHLLPAELVRARCEERLNQMDAGLVELRRVEEELRDPNGRPASPSHANDEWVVRYGITVLELARTHLRDQMGNLIATAQGNSQAAE